MNQLKNLFRIIAIALPIIFAVACQNGRGGLTGNKTGKTINWNDSAYSLYVKIQELFNNDMHDSLLAVTPKAMEFMREHQQWDYYYCLWQNMAEDHVWYSEYPEAISEAEDMQKDAIERKDTFGLALSYITQATAYLAQDQFSVASDIYDKAIRIFPQNRKIGELISAYAYYADCLDNIEEYSKMELMLKEWHTLLEGVAVSTDSSDIEAYADWHRQYYTHLTKYLISTKNLEQAENVIDSIMYYSKISGLINNYLLHYDEVKHQLAMAQGNYKEAFDASDDMLKLAKDDASFKIRALQDRSEALEKLGKYQEALADARLFKLLNDSITQSDNRAQLNHLNKRYQINELQAQNNLLLHRSRFTTGGVAMILGIVALLAFLSVNSRWTRRIEIKNQQLQRERNVVVSQNKQLALERDRAEAASKAKTAFIQSMTHEIRTPLNAISGFSQVLTMTEADVTPEIRTDMSRRIMDGTRMLTNIIDDLILISDFESRTGPSPTEECLIDFVVNQAMEAVYPLLQKGVVIESESSLSPELVVKTSPQVIQKVLTKLLENAAKFTSEGRITLTMGIIDSKLHLSVSDTGPGIPADKREYIFERFAKLDSFSQGAGLGLTIVRMLTEHLGGSVNLDGEYSGGSKFDVIIPISLT